MSRFLPGTNPEYIKTVNNALYGEGHEASLKGDETVREELLQEAAEIGSGCDDGYLVDDNGVCVAEVTDDADKVVTAGFMGLPKVAWIAIIGVGVYYAYSKGMFKKLIK